jgi:hypothetical protein
MKRTGNVYFSYTCLKAYGYAELICVAECNAEIEMTIMSDFQIDISNSVGVSDCNSYALVTILGQTFCV